MPVDASVHICSLCGNETPAASFQICPQCYQLICSERDRYAAEAMRAKEDLQATYTHMANMEVSAMRMRDTMRNRICELESILSQYGRHKRGCPASQDDRPEVQCLCGFRITQGC